MATTLHSPFVASTSTATAQFDRANRHLTAYISGELDVSTVSSVDEAISQRIQPD
ncbi:MAG: hypothetical protein JWO77_2852, partial [Ilumatobacteraceae bacterium]|nr:hypothetical protein [Ilumatobacteraceae bacterium]